jgi:hypothetical protein
MQVTVPNQSSAGANACTGIGAVLLPASPKLTKHDFDESTNYRRVESSDDLGNSIFLITPLRQPKAFERHGVWYGDETRVDSLGRRWRRTLEAHFVVDNFGDLVEVAR